MESCDEQRIVEGLRNGDIASWHEFHIAFSESVWRTVAVRLGGRTADILDIVQETFLKAVRSIHSFDATRGRLEYWLGGVARCQVREYLRREERHNRLTQVDGTSAAVAEVHRRLAEYLRGRTPEPSELLQQAETVALVRKILDELNPDHAYVLMAKYMDELSVEVMAAEMDLSPGAVSAKLARARQSFRQLFTRYPEEIGKSLDHENE